jgi:CelD/BcsL family acetyltransferase involved in cellulose biosynthesis
VPDSERFDPDVAERYDIVAEPARFAALRPEWEALRQRARNPYVSQSFAWCAAAWETVARPRGRRLACVVGRAAGRVVLIWPLVADRRGPWTVLSTLGSESSEYSEPLVEDGAVADHRVGAAWRAIRRRADLVRLPHVRSDGRLARVLAAERPTCARHTLPATQVEWDAFPRWESYLASRPKEHQSELRRRRRRLAERGSLSFEVLNEASDRAAAIDWMLRHKQDWLARTRLANPWLGTREYRDFLLAVTAPGAAGAEIAVFLLKLDGRLIAAALSALDGARVEGLIGAFDPAFGVHSPGQLLQEDRLRWAFERRLPYDFRIGDEAYKRHWVTDRCEAVSYTIAGSCGGWPAVAAGAARQGAHRLKERHKHIVPADWRHAIKQALRSGLRRRARTPSAARARP